MWFSSSRVSRHIRSSSGAANKRKHDEEQLATSRDTVINKAVKTMKPIRILAMKAPRLCWYHFVWLADDTVTIPRDSAVRPRAYTWRSWSRPKKTVFSSVECTVDTLLVEGNLLFPSHVGILLGREKVKKKNEMVTKTAK
jgi:hypothetical protein